jgi:ABC-2 type transport system permease protein
VITRTARTFAALVARDIQITLTYRAWLFWLLLGNLPVPVISLLVWRGAAALGAELPVAQTYLVTYFVLVALVSMLTSCWSAAFLADSIRLGDLASWLVRPCSTHLNGIANNVAEKIAKLVLMVPMVAVLALVVHRQVRLPSDPLRWLGFVVAIVLGAVITFAIDVLLGSLAFWLEEVSGLLRARNLVAGVLSGAVVPLALMPAAFQPALALQPFRFVVSFPLEVLLLPTATAAGFALAAGWALALTAAAVLVWRTGLRGYQAAGA